MFRRIFSRYFKEVRNYSGAFKPKNQIRLKNEALQNVMSSNVGEIEWESVRSELLASERSVNLNNLDGIIIGHCSKEYRLDIAKSYVDFMKKKSLSINDASVGKLLRLFYHNHIHQKSLISEKDEMQIMKFCSALIEKHPTLNDTLAENVIHGLCLTKDWMKSLELLNHFCVDGSSPTSTSYSCIISKALQEDKLDIAWNLLHQMTSEQIIPRPSIFIEFFRKLVGNEVETEKLMNVISENSLMMPEKSIGDFQKVFRDKCKVVQINRSGACLSCSNKLSSIQLNADEFAKLSSTFLDDVLIRKDVFLKSSPGEVARFKKFVDMTSPYDCVIDGLNVAYSHGTQQGPKNFAKNIAMAVKYFVDRNESLLVIGRKHMSSWPKKEMDYIRRNSSLFLADNLSQDDPFMLFAALKSGPKTKIFSRDLMRSHSFLLDCESKKLFRRWQQQQQYSLITTLQNDEILVREPIGFEVQAHKVGDYWHVPFTIENLQFTYESFEMPAKWLCVKV